MAPADALRLAVLASATWAVAALAATWAWARAHGSRPTFARPAGERAAGIRYAFTGAMLPQAKESVRLHVPTYVAGLAFHVGAFAALALLAAGVAGLAVPAPARTLLLVLTLLGAAAGLSLLGKRLVTPHLRGLSVPDDYVANALTTAFSALAGASLVVPALTPAWLLSACLLFAYLPVGKIRHCVFFFSSRAHLGAFFGFRGVFPSTRG